MRTLAAVFVALAVAAPAAKAKRVTVKGLSHHRIRVEVKGRTGVVCRVVVRRRLARRIVTVDLAGTGEARFVKSVPGPGRPRARATCAYPDEPALRPGQIAITSLSKAFDELTIDAFARGGATKDVTVHRDLEGVFDDWRKLQYLTYQRASWSSDFSKLLFTGTPAGTRDRHIGVLDLRTLRVTDLTAARDPEVGCEHSPRFVGQARPVAGYGDDQVVFLEGARKPSGACGTGDAQLLTSLSRPAAAAAAGADFNDLHPEASGAWSFAQGRGLNRSTPDDSELVFIGDLPSPDGRYVTAIGGSTGTVAVTRAADGAVLPANCPGFSDARLLGWRDARTFLVRGVLADEETAWTVRIGAGDAITCDRTLPGGATGTNFGYIGDELRFTSAEGGVKEYLLSTGDLINYNLLFDFNDRKGLTGYYEVGPAQR